MGKQLPLVAFLLFTCASIVFGDTGAPIPEPNYGMIEVARIAKDYFHSNFSYGKRFTEVPGFYIKDFVLMSAKYTNSFKENKLQEWAWIVTFRHPIHNDNSFTFKVDNSGEVTLLERAE